MTFTRDQVMALQGRELDAAVAVQIMGMKEVAVWAPAGTLCHVVEGRGHCIVPLFHSDPAADLEAHRVACGWEDQQFGCYLRCLAEALLERARHAGSPLERAAAERSYFDSSAAWLSLAWMRFYQVGDYARAALLTVVG